MAFGNYCIIILPTLELLEILFCSMHPACGQILLIFLHNFSQFSSSIICFAMSSVRGPLPCRSQSGSALQPLLGDGRSVLQSSASSVSGPSLLPLSSLPVITLAMSLPAWLHWALLGDQVSEVGSFFLGSLVCSPVSVPLDLAHYL